VRLLSRPVSYPNAMRGTAPRCVALHSFVTTATFVLCWCCSVPAIGAAAVATSSDGAQQNKLRIGLRPAAARAARRLLLQAAASAPAAAAVTTESAPASFLERRDASRAAAGRSELITLMPNDTISEEYWMTVNAAISKAAKVTAAPSSLNDPAPTPTPEPWKKVFQASQTVDVVDTPQEVSALNDWQMATPMPPTFSHSPGDLSARTIGVVPYDMQIGARIMYGLSEKNTETPPPSQTVVDETFTAQCPMVMFANQIFVGASQCGNPLGVWADPLTQRTIMRWQSNGKGGLTFGVDSLISGNGSVNFATFAESFSVDQYIFDLSNCLGVTRFKVEESIVKVNQMAQKASSTMIDHDLSNTATAIFYQYTIKNPSGTTVAKTDLFRMGWDAVNITRWNADVPTGEVIAIATRQGHWKEAQWHSCTSPPRGWILDFPTGSNLDTVATVQDLRVASTAVINMMAYRDEEAGADGFQHVGQGELYWSITKSILIVVFIALFGAISLLICKRKGVDKKLRRFCFRLEQVIMPKRPTKVRQPVLNPTY